jgi:hypothetical protein
MVIALSRCAALSPVGGFCTPKLALVISLTTRIETSTRRLYLRYFALLNSLNVLFYYKLLMYKVQAELGVALPVNDNSISSI